MVAATGAVLLGLMVVSAQNPPVASVKAPRPLSNAASTTDNFDIRASAGTAPALAQARAVAALKAQLGDAVTVRFSARTGGVTQMLRQGGYLTEGAGGAPADVLDAFLAGNGDVLGLSAAALATFTPSRQDVDRAGVTHIYMDQHVGGLRVFGTTLKGHVDKFGRVISFEGEYYPAAATLAGTTTLSAKDALLAAMRATMPDLLQKVLPQQVPATLSGEISVTPGDAFPALLQAESGPDRLTLFDKGPFMDPIRVRLVAFPTAAGSRTAWQVELNAPAQEAYYVVLVDAATGRLLYRANTARTLSTSLASIFPKNPDSSPLVITPYSGDAVASPAGWSSVQGTYGNNVQAISATSTGDFTFSFSNAWKNTGANSFDLAGKRVRFTPTSPAANGYSSVPSAAGAIVAGATNLIPLVSNTDDGTALVACAGFSFNILGGTYTQFYANTNGSVSFGAGITSFTPAKVDFSSDTRRIAGLWRDLYPGGGGTFTTDCVVEGAGKTARVVWINTPDFGTAVTNTFSITMHGTGTGLDGVIDLDYGTVSPNGDLIGVGGNLGTPGAVATTGLVNYRDLSLAASPGIPGGLAQTFPDPDLNVSITNFGYHLNAMHDFFYRLGFTESAGSYQMSNFSRGGAPADLVRAEAQYQLRSYNNAFFAPTPDGTPAVTAFGLFDDGAGCRRDSGLDAGVVYHEYTHGVTTRMIGGLEIFTALQSFQGGALGEGWSDATAITALNDPVVGAYVTCNVKTGIRSAPYDAHPGTFGDLGNKVSTLLYLNLAPGIGETFAPEVHQDGEIWAATAWDIRSALGPAITQQLLFDGLRYTPLEPSMIEARDGVLIADQIDYGGAHMNALFSVFAKRGLGASAAISQGTYSTAVGDGWTTTVFAAFDTPANRYAPDPASVLFNDGFEGANLWTVTGADGAGGGALWHVSTRRASEGTNAFYYGKEATGTYDTGFRNYGALTSPSIPLPPLIAGQTLALEWDQLRNTSNPFLYDAGFVRVLDVNAGTTTQVSFVQNTSVTNNAYTWAHQKVNLQAFAGRTVKIQFYMDRFNAGVTTAEGWYVDNVSVRVYASSGPATVTTGAASNVFSRGATLNGTANPNGAATVAYFEYGSTTAYGKTTPQVNLGSASGTVGIGSNAIVGLACGSTYHFRAVAINSGGTSTGADQAFTTSAGPCASAVADVDNDGRSDLMVFRKSSGTWLSLLSGSGYTTADGVSWGESTDIPLAGDFDGDGRTDRTFYRPSNGTWNILKSSSNFTASYVVQWGASTDIPIQGDIDGDGRADIIVWRPSNGTFWWLTSSTNYSYAFGGVKQWGNGGLGDIPMVADIDGDRKADLIVWRPNVGTFFILTSTTGYDYNSNIQKQFGTAGDIPMIGDIDGDGRGDLIVWRPSLGIWFWLTSSSGYNPAAAGMKGWGASTDIPMLLDVDGDRAMDLVVWRPSTGFWFWLSSSSGYNYASQGQVQWGNFGLGDVPVSK